ncbi:MAG: hypothetical protein ABID61_02945 [Candidatus Micrarchaeota archaeon]
MTSEEKTIFWDRTNFAMQLMNEKDNESAKFQILGFMNDWFSFLVGVKEQIFKEIGQNPNILVENKGFLPLYSAKLATNPQLADLKTKNDGLYTVSMQLWKTTDPNQDLSAFIAYLKENKNRIYGYTTTYEDIKKMNKEIRSDDIQKVFSILKKYNQDILPKMKEFASVSPDPGTFVIYCAANGQWELMTIIDRISLIPFYANTVYTTVRQRELKKMKEDVPKIESDLTESSVIRLDNIRGDLDRLLEINEKDEETLALSKQVNEVIVKAKVVYDKILEERRMSADSYKGNDKEELRKLFLDAYKKAYPKEMPKRVTILGENWITKEDKVAQFRDGSPGTVVATQQTFRYKLLEAEIGIVESTDPKNALVYGCWFRRDIDMEGKEFGNYYMHSSECKFKMFAANLDK